MGRVHVWNSGTCLRPEDRCGILDIGHKIYKLSPMVFGGDVEGTGRRVAQLILVFRCVPKMRLIKVREK